MKKLPVLFIAVVCAVLVKSSLSQVHTADTLQTPEQVVNRYFAQIKLSGFGSIASLIHPDELRKFREMMAPVIEQSLITGDRTFAQFADEKTPTRMRPMDDLTLMNTFMEWVTSTVPGAVDALKNATVQPLGHVVEGELKHVVVRSRVAVDELEIEKMSVVSVKDHNGRPMLLLTGDIKGLAESLKRRR